MPLSRIAASALGALLLLRSGTLRAETTEEVAQAEAEFIRTHGDRPVVALGIRGLSRTRPAVIEQWIDCRIGQPLSGCNLAEIRRRLYDLAIFSEVGVDLGDEPAGVRVTIVVEEKWTLYPVPMLWYSPGTELAGLVLVEANLFGYNKGLAIGGIYSNRGWYTLAGYNDPNIGYTNLWGSVHAFLGSGFVENDAPDGSIEQSYDMTRFDLEYALGWTFWDRLSPAWNGALRVARVGQVYVPGSVSAADETVLVQGPQLIYSDRRYRDFYDAGLRLSVEGQHAFPLDGGSSSYNAGIVDAKWAGAAPLGGVVDWHVHGFAGSMPVVFEERLGELEGSRTIPGSGLVAADRYASLSLEYQVPVVVLSPGIVTGLVFGELGRYARNEEAGVTYGGPGVGMRFFLRRVALPAVGVDVGYDVWSMRTAVSVMVGYRPMR